MLFIETDTRKIEWHCGEPFPELDGRVVKFQADGHELAWLQDAVNAGKHEADHNYYRDVWGV